MNTTPYTIIPDLNALVETTAPDSIISRTFYKDGLLNAVLFAFDAGQALSEHTAAQIALLHFIAGEATVTVEEETIQAVSGTWIRLAPRVPHSVVARSPVKMLLLLVSSEEA